MRRPVWRCPTLSSRWCYCQRCEPAAARTLAEVSAAYALDDFAEILNQWTPRSGGHGAG